MLFKKRSNVHDVTIFGAGKQAYWHARLALLLRGDEIHHLNIINRSFETAGSLVHDLYKIPWPVDIHHPQTTIVTPMHTEYQRYLKSTIRASSVIFCTTPSTEPLFPPEYLTSTEGRKKGRYVAAIGSYKPHMIELHPDILRQAVAPSHKHHHHKHAKQGGAVVVDSVEACLKEAGEVIQAGLGGREVVELGELVMLKRDAEAKRINRRESESSLDSAGVELGGKTKGAKGEDDDGGLGEWLQRGNVVYKSVGLGLMDVVVGGDLVRLADARGVGTRLEKF
jgi:ornithine cyclodeaminase/alanine dehydrogenase-like protein (mu-crystallin family)